MISPTAATRAERHGERVHDDSDPASADAFAMIARSLESGRQQRDPVTEASHDRRHDVDRNVASRRPVHLENRAAIGAATTADTSTDPAEAAAADVLTDPAEAAAADGHETRPAAGEAPNGPVAVTGTSAPDAAAISGSAPHAAGTAVSSAVVGTRATPPASEVGGRVTDSTAGGPAPSPSPGRTDAPPTGASIHTELGDAPGTSTAGVPADQAGPPIDPRSATPLDPNLPAAPLEAAIQTPAPSTNATSSGTEEAPTQTTTDALGHAAIIDARATEPPVDGSDGSRILRHPISDPTLAAGSAPPTGPDPVTRGDDPRHDIVIETRSTPTPAPTPTPQGTSTTNPASVAPVAPHHATAAPQRTTAPPPVSAAPPLPDADPNVARLSGATRTLHGDGTGSVTLSLTPVELGRVKVELTADGSSLRLHLTADHAHGADALRHAASALRSELESDGLSIDHLGVSVNGSGVDSRNGAAARGGDWSGGRQHAGADHRSASSERAPIFRSTSDQRASTLRPAERALPTSGVDLHL